jgi:hypothetical protein
MNFFWFLEGYGTFTALFSDSGRKAMPLHEFYCSDRNIQTRTLLDEEDIVAMIKAESAEKEKEQKLLLDKTTMVEVQTKEEEILTLRDTIKSLKLVRQFWIQKSNQSMAKIGNTMLSSAEKMEIMSMMQPKISFKPRKK